MDVALEKYYPQLNNRANMRRLADRLDKGMGFSINLKKLKKQLSAPVKAAEQALQTVEKTATVVANTVKKDVNGAIKIVKSADEDLLHVTDFVPRDSFLALVMENVFDLAGRLNEHVQAGDVKGLQNIWQAIGGNWGKLLAAINKGKNKKPLLGVDRFIGLPQAIAADVVAAAGITAAISKFLTAIKPQTKTLQNLELGLDTASAGGDIAGGNFTQASQNMINAAGVAGAAFSQAQASGTMPAGITYQPSGSNTAPGGFAQLTSRITPTEIGVGLAALLGLGIILKKSNS
jgi:hypothetical protein